MLSHTGPFPESEKDNPEGGYFTSVLALWPLVCQGSPPQVDFREPFGTGHRLG